MILDMIRKNRQLFKDVGQVVIAVDGKASWRKAVFPHYKFRRAEDKAKLAPNVNWTEVYKTINKISDEIKNHLPYIVIKHDHAEGDDIIGEVVRWYHAERPMENIVILSGDKDFKQLHFTSRVRQFSPTLKKFVVSQGADFELRDIIMTGDRLDGVPNILSPDHSFVSRVKQSKMTAGRKEFYHTCDPTQIEDTIIRRNWVRNEILVDLNKTPGSIKQSIREQLIEQLEAPKKPSSFFPYLVEHRLTELMPRAGEFV